MKSMVFGGHRFLSLVSTVFPLALLPLSFDVFVGVLASGIDCEVACFIEISACLASRIKVNCSLIHIFWLVFRMCIKFSVVLSAFTLSISLERFDMMVEFIF